MNDENIVKKVCKELGIKEENSLVPVELVLTLSKMGYSVESFKTHNPNTKNLIKNTKYKLTLVKSF